jgi:hypothetical protein
MAEMRRKPAVSVGLTGVAPAKLKGRPAQLNEDRNWQQGSMTLLLTLGSGYQQKHSSGARMCIATACEMEKKGLQRAARLQRLRVG